MLWSVNDLRRWKIHAVDGDLGAVSDVYFDDAHWVARYLIVDTGVWLPGRQVLVSPHSVGRLDRDRRVVNVDLTRKRIEDSPEVSTAQPVSRQAEVRLAEYYAWPIYWGPYGLLDAPTATISSGNLPPVPLHKKHAAVDTAPPDPHLRSAREVIGYSLAAADGHLGHVEDFLLTDDDWALRYVVVDTRNWLPGKQVLVAPHWVRSIDWANSEVAVDLPRELIRTSPPFHPDQPVTREYEAALHAHYGRPGYWDSGAEI